MPVNSKCVVELAAARRLAACGEAHRIREAAGLSLAEVAGAVGISIAALSRWETGHRRPSGAPAVAWARLLAKLEGATGEPTA